MTIAQLENMLNSRRQRLNDLMRERRKIQQRLDAVDRQIADVNGRGIARMGGNGMGGGRVRNPASLVATMESVLKSAGKPLRVGDIADAVLRTGYKTNSANFRGIVNQTLIKEKQFSAADRGVYQLKK